MLKPAILATIRQVLTLAGTALVAKCYVQASEVEPVIGALLTVGSVVWSVADKRGRLLSLLCRQTRGLEVGTVFRTGMSREPPRVQWFL